MSELGDALEVMHTSAQRWNRLRLEGHEWRHHDVLSRAWKHHFAELRRSGTSVQSAVGFKTGNDEKAQIESRYSWRFWVAKPDKRRAEFRVGNETVSVVSVGAQWWSWSPRGFQTNDGALSSSHGFGPGEALPASADYLAALDLSVGGRTTFLSRSAFLVTALPRIRPSYLHDMTLHMLGTGADRYKLIVDAEVGVLLRSGAEFRGETFRVVEVEAIGINEEFSAKTFDGERLRTGALDL
jgi:hypothetical protein